MGNRVRTREMYKVAVTACAENDFTSIAQLSGWAVANGNDAVLDALLCKKTFRALDKYLLARMQDRAMKGLQKEIDELGELGDEDLGAFADLLGSMFSRKSDNNDRLGK